MMKVTIISKTQNLHMFTIQGDLLFVEKSALNLWKNSIIFRPVSVNINGGKPPCLSILKTMSCGNHAKNALKSHK